MTHWGLLGEYEQMNDLDIMQRYALRVTPSEKCGHFMQVLPLQDINFMLILFWLIAHPARHGCDLHTSALDLDALARQLHHAYAQASREKLNELREWEGDGDGRALEAARKHKWETEGGEEENF
eukprot:736510-Pleurochrysis_carterae.AAC.1